MIRQLNINSIRHKLFIAVLLTTVSALLISGLTMMLYDLKDYKARLRQELTTQAKLLGLSSAPALEFGDQQLAMENLALLDVQPQILAAAIYAPDNSLFASYSSQADTVQLPAIPDRQGLWVENGRLLIFQEIIHNDAVVGTVFLKMNYPINERLRRNVGILLVVIMPTLAFSMLLALWLQTRVTRPILTVTKLAREVTGKRDYSLRAERKTNDEIGNLVDSLNSLLAEVERSSQALELSNAELQQQILEREYSDRALYLSERRHRTLVTALTSVVWTATADGEFVGEQKPWDEYTGQTPDTHSGRGWLDAFHQEDRRFIEQGWERAHRLMQPLKSEVRLWHKRDSRYRYVQLHAVPLYDDRGLLHEWIGTADDIDDRRRAIEEIQRLNAELEQRVSVRTAELERANRELEAFSYSVSHDLRTPLRAIDGFSQALLEDYGEQFDASGRDYIARVRAGAQRMGRLIDDLLMLARVSRGDFIEETLDLTAMAEDVVAELRTDDPERAVKVDIAPGLTAFGDSRLMRVALENLFSNAWKYTSKRDEARIEFGLCPEKYGDDCYVVKDNGAGFDMTYVDKLFGAFQRLHDATEFPGTGIGLATVQRIIHRHGGRIWAEAEIGEGAAFYFTLRNEQESHDD